MGRVKDKFTVYQVEMKSLSTFREGRGGEGRGGEGRGGEREKERWKEEGNGLLHGKLTLAVCVAGMGSVGRAVVWSRQS